MSRQITYTAPRLPVTLTSLRNWLVWRLVQKPEKIKPDKVPFYVNGNQREGVRHGDEVDRKALATFEDAVAAVHNGGFDGIGFATLTDANIVALDFDNCVVERRINPLVTALCEGTYTEFSPSGTGIRAFYCGRLTNHSDAHAKWGAFPLEVFGTSGYVTVTGNVIENCSLFGHDQLIAPLSSAVLAEYRSRGWNSTATDMPEDVDTRALMTLEPTLGWTHDELRAYLTDCDAGADREAWLYALMAAHHEIGGSAEGLDIVDAWSATGANYVGRRDVEGRWRSFGNGGSVPVTGKWLLKWRGECIARKRYEAAKQQKQRITDCADEFTLREKVCAEIARDGALGDMEREALAQLLYDRFKTLGTKYPIAQCRKLIAERRTMRYDGDAPEWTAGWVYVTDRDQFYRMDSDEWLSRQSFNAAFNRLLPKNDTGHVLKNAADLALEDHEVPYATRGIYLPWAGELFELHGVACVNTYRPSSVPMAVEQISPTGQRAIDLVVRHVDMLAGGRREVTETLIAWLAHNVQKPGVKIRWAPLIKGVEGDGKTLLGSLLAACMGHANVKQISPKVLGTDFTDWAHGACVGVLEEIKLTGHNRHDILNALKPFITNDIVAVHPKGLAEYNVVNTQNYLAFTNHSDALPLSDTDRRWYIVFTPFATTSALTDAIAAMGTDVAGYFNGLYHATSTQCAELRRWLLDYPLVGFEPNSSAPHTREKNLMVGMSASPEEEMVREVIAEGAEGVTATVLSSTSLVEAAQVSDPAVALQTNTLNRLLVRLGWQKVGRLKWNGRPHRVWVKGSVPNDNESLRAVLDATLPVGALSTETAARLFDSVPDSVPDVSPL